MDSQDQGVVAGSRLRLPQKVNHSPGKGLSEMSASANNARFGAIPPPGTLGTKHKPSGLPEPQPKRKTLVERAGTTTKDAAFASSLPVSDPFKITAPSMMRNGSFASSASSRTTSNSSARLPPHGSSFSSHSTAGSRPNALRYKRPGTATGHSRSNTQPSNIFRPGTAMDSTAGVKSQSNAFDPDERLRDISSIWETKFEEFSSQMKKSMSEQKSLDEVVALLKAKINELEGMRDELTQLNTRLRNDLDDTKAQLATSNVTLDDLRRSHSFEVDDLRRQYRNDLEDLKQDHRRKLDEERKISDHSAEKIAKDFEEQIESLLKVHKEELSQAEKQLKTELEEERSRRNREIQELSTQLTLKLQNAGLDLDTKHREAESVRAERDQALAALDREKALRLGVEHKLADAASSNIALETANRAMKAKIDFLESDNQAQSSAFVDLHKRMQEAIDEAALTNEKLRAEETLRRKLHNQVQELRGNIRVMCRVRPAMDGVESDPAKIDFPDEGVDSKELMVTGPEKVSAMGNVTATNNAFSFDRVFTPVSQNAEVFEEISQLVQSALDGYNVCIFCYGQTGSGKTFTMSSADGMIPRATAQIYAEAQRLEEKGWTYKMEGSFVEVYNENLNDLLGKAEELDKKKLEIRHDAAKKQTMISNVTTVPLDSPTRVEEILERAASNRSVAATMANQRSSRSHSVFILKLVGENSITGERSEGTLNLVDLAGSERLSHSGVTGDRLKETQNINRSLSCLGDVISALGSGKEGAHIPYRNSKLTYLLQYSLGGNSKTLMFVMVSPLQVHLNETLTSLKFATKVHNTHIGTAKRQSKVKD